MLHQLVTRLVGYSVKLLLRPASSVYSHQLLELPMEFRLSNVLFGLQFPPVYVHSSLDSATAFGFWRRRSGCLWRLGEEVDVRQPKGEVLSRGLR